MTHSTNGTDHLQEPALRYARQDFPIIRDSVTVEEALTIIWRVSAGLPEGQGTMRTEQIAHLRMRHEVLA
jgi:hypothetical protein